MRIGDALYFSPRYRFADLDLDDAEKTIAALSDRISGFYLDPAARLIEANDAFAAGVLCCVAIDFIALCAGDKPEVWLDENVEAFREKNVASQFWKRFRDGLVHEGRIKAFGQFSFDFRELVTIADPALIVNPKRLHEATQEAFSRYLAGLDPETAERLTKRLRRYFSEEIKFAKQ